MKTKRFCTVFVVKLDDSFAPKLRVFRQAFPLESNVIDLSGEKCKKRKRKSSCSWTFCTI